MRRPGHKLLCNTLLGASVLLHTPAAARPEVPRADLVIVAARATREHPALLRVHVANHGAAAAASTNLRLFYQKGHRHLTADGAVPALAPGGAAWVQVRAPGPLDEARHVTLRVDEPNRVRESNESNNGYVYK